MLNYDPDGRPEIDPQSLKEATDLGLKMIHVICDEPGAKVGDASGVSFPAFVDFVPQVGDRIGLEDGSSCSVKRVYYKLARMPGKKWVSMLPNVFAVRISKDTE